jgi:hypothetical protein
MKSKGLNYSELYKVVAALDRHNRMSAGGVSINDVINQSALSNEAKTYFKQTLQVCEEKNFGINKQDKKISFENKYFKELLKYV